MENKIKELNNKILQLENELKKAHKLIIDMEREQVIEMKEHQNFCIIAEQKIYDVQIKLIKQIKINSPTEYNDDNVKYYLISEEYLDNLITKIKK